MSPYDTLDGTVVLVTGSTRGIGRHTALALANQGAALAVCGRDDQQARQLASELTSTYRVQAYGRGLDVSDASAVEVFARASEQELGPVSVVINNAAILGPIGALHSSDSAAWSHAVSVNLIGVANVVRSFWDQLAFSGRGRVVNLAGGGVGGPSPMQRATAYVTSKAAVMALTEALAQEAVAIGVTVNAIAPGPIATSFMDGVLAAGAEVAGDEMFREAAGRVDRDISAAAAPYLNLLRYVISADSAMINGRTLSARWEHPQRLAALIEQGLDESRFRLRRIDAELYGALQ